MLLWAQQYYCLFHISKNYFNMAMADELQDGSELAGLMIGASHRTFSGQNKHMSGQIKFGWTNLLYIINGNFIEFVEKNGSPDKVGSLS